MRKSIGWLLVAALAGAFWLAAGAMFAETALRPPRRAVRGAGEEVTIQAADGVELRASFLRPGLSQCVLLLHGIADSRTGSLGFAPMFEDFAVLAPDSRAHGNSGGDIVTFGVRERDDVLRWAAYARSRGCQTLYGLGVSLGGAILIQAASGSDVFSAIVAEAPFTSLPDIAEERIGQAGAQWLGMVVLPPGMLWVRLRHGVDLRRASPLQAIKTLTTPLLLIHGADDRNTSARHSRQLAAIAPQSSLWLVPGARHANASSVAPDEYRRRVLMHFRQARDARHKNFR